VSILPPLFVHASIHPSIHPLTKSARPFHPAITSQALIFSVGV
jgi:hypothetical protein